MYIKIGKGLLCPTYNGMEAVKITKNKTDAIYLDSYTAILVCKRLKREFGLRATPVGGWELDD